MEYKNIKNKYYDLWKVKDESYGEIEDKKPVVIFLDGKNVTKYHDKYPMIGKYNFTEMMMHYGYELVKEIGADAVIYASLDEISFIFSDTDKLIHYIKDDSRSCIGSLFVQKFVEKFWKYKKAYFKSTVFNIDSENIGEWIEFRKAVGDNTGLMYVAKEYLPIDLYKDKSGIELEHLLRETGLDSVCKKNKYIREGYYKEYRGTDIADAMDDFFSNCLEQ